VHSVRGSHRRSWSPDSVESQGQSIVCSYAECGKSFAVPIDLRVLVENERARYYACPYCFWPVGLEAVVLEDAEVERVESRSRVEVVKSDGCEHFVGYLRTRPEKSPISDECLACGAIMKCMVSGRGRGRKSVRARL